MRVITIAVLGTSGCSLDESVEPARTGARRAHSPSPSELAMNRGGSGSGGVAIAILDLGAGDGSAAEAVNDKGQIVGTGGTGVGAFLWENGVIRRLGTLPGLTSARAEDINESGQAVGYFFDGAGHHAFIWTAAGGMQPLAGSLGGCCSLARAINDQGVVLGEASLAGSGAHAVVWENGVMRDVQAFPTGSTFPWDLSNTGIGVGQWDGPNGAFRWTAAGGMAVMPGLEGPGDIPIGVNDVGQIVGWYRRTSTDVNKAFLWTNGVITDLGTLGGASSVATAINNAGEVVGRAEVPRKGSTAGYRAFLWTAGAGMKDLGTPGGRTNAQVFDVNETGWVVGEITSGSGQTRATLWKLR